MRGVVHMGRSILPLLWQPSSLSAAHLRFSRKLSSDDGRFGGPGFSIGLDARFQLVSMPMASRSYSAGRSS